MCKDFHVLLSPLLYISFLGKECQQGFLFLLIFFSDMEKCSLWYFCLVLLH